MLHHVMRAARSKSLGMTAPENSNGFNLVMHCIASVACTYTAIARHAGCCLAVAVWVQYQETCMWIKYGRAPCAIATSRRHISSTRQMGCQLLLTSSDPGKHLLGPSSISSGASSWRERCLPWSTTNWKCLLEHQTPSPSCPSEHHHLLCFSLSTWLCDQQHADWCGMDMCRVTFRSCCPVAIAPCSSAASPSSSA